MRELTQQEIDNAPDWATHYYVSELGGSDVVHYLNKEKLRMSMTDDLLGSITAKVSKRCQSYIMTKPIPRKPFDIRSHTFSDEDVNYQGQSNENCLDLAVDDNSDDDCSYFCITKQDAIAIAKHFKLI